MVWVTSNDYDDAFKPLIEIEEKTDTVYTGRAKTNLEHYLNLNVFSPKSNTRLTGIVCTIGPISKKIDILEQMIERGMNIARINVAYGTYEQQQETIKNLRTACDNCYQKFGFSPCIAIGISLKGPQIFTGFIDSTIKEPKIRKGENVKLTNESIYIDKCSSQVIYVDLENLTKYVKIGTQIYIDCGQIILSCITVIREWVTCIVLLGGTLKSFKTVHIPDILPELPTTTQKDKKDIEFAIENRVDFIFISFPRNAENIREIRHSLGDRGKYIKLVAKIECFDCLHNLDEIIEASDGIMIARGEIGISIPIQKVFLAQKTIIARCNLMGKPVICAKNMLESMVKKIRPSRSEVSDAANAILDGTDCVQLTSETIEGNYPIDCLKTLSLICREAEIAFWQRRVFTELTEKLVPPITPKHALAIAAVEISLQCQANAIFVITKYGQTPQLISKYRPRCPIIAITRYAPTSRQIHICRGCIPVHYTDPLATMYEQDIENQYFYALHFCKAFNILKCGDLIIFLYKKRSIETFNNTLKIIQIDDGRDEFDEMF